MMEISFTGRYNNHTDQEMQYERYAAQSSYTEADAVMTVTGSS